MNIHLSIAKSDCAQNLRCFRTGHQAHDGMGNFIHGSTVQGIIDVEKQIMRVPTVAQCMRHACHGSDLVFGYVGR